MMQPTFLDKIVSAISPEAGLRRLVARKRLTHFGYDGARSSRARNNTPLFQAPESSRTQSDRIALMKQALDLENNVGFVKCMFSRVVNYVCGDLSYQAMTGEDDADNEYEDYLDQWFRVCDVTGRSTFREKAQLTIRSVMREGDIGHVIVRQKGLPLQLQSIEADCIGGTHVTAVSNNYFGGVIVNDIGAPIAYRVFERSAQGAYVNPRDIPAESFIHVYDPKHSSQYRGITALHSCIATLRDIYEILEFEKMGVKWATSNGGIVTTQSGSDESGYSFDESAQDPNGNVIRSQTVEGAQLIHLSPGEDYKAFSYDRPSTTFQGFVETLYREGCLAIDMPFGFMYDMSKLSGPAARFESAQAQRTIRRWQLLLEDKFTNRAKNLALMEGIATGQIRPTQAWSRGKWMYPAHPTIDVGRESKANLDENRQGAKSLADIYSEQGKDWQDELRQIAKEQAAIKDLAQEYGIDPQDIAMKTPNGTPIVSQQNSEPPPTD